jgi:tryptophan synthase beta chain
MKLPDKKGHFGIYGGRYVSETLMPALLELEYAYTSYKKDPDEKHHFSLPSALPATWEELRST